VETLGIFPGREIGVARGSDTWSYCSRRSFKVEVFAPSSSPIVNHRSESPSPQGYRHRHVVLGGYPPPIPFAPRFDSRNASRSQIKRRSITPPINPRHSQFGSCMYAIGMPVASSQSSSTFHMLWVILVHAKSGVPAWVTGTSGWAEWKKIPPMTTTSHCADDHSGVSKSQVWSPIAISSPYTRLP
jgi:hypothetical protein